MKKGIPLNDEDRIPCKKSLYFVINYKIFF